MKQNNLGISLVRGWLACLPAVALAKEGNDRLDLICGVHSNPPSALFWRECGELRPGLGVVDGDVLRTLRGVAVLKYRPSEVFFRCGIERHPQLGIEPRFGHEACRGCWADLLGEFGEPAVLLGGEDSLLDAQFAQSNL